LDMVLPPPPPTPHTIIPVDEYYSVSAGLNDELLADYTTVV
jgi:hypothetical protein